MRYAVYFDEDSVLQKKYGQTFGKNLEQRMKS